jgi:hypothetical protein
MLRDVSVITIVVTFAFLFAKVSLAAAHQAKDKSAIQSGALFAFDSQDTCRKGGELG